MGLLNRFLSFLLLLFAIIPRSVVSYFGGCVTPASTTFIRNDYNNHYSPTRCQIIPSLSLFSHTKKDQKTKHEQYKEEQEQEQEQIVTGQGITSIATLTTPINSYFFGGSKRGKLFNIHSLPFQTNNKQSSKNLHAPNRPHYDLEQTNVTILKDDNHDDDIFKKPYPIYSMKSYYNEKNQIMGLACGGGDRFVTVWEFDYRYNNNNNNDKKQWRVVSRLGPHTGWIKDLVIINNEPAPKQQQQQTQQSNQTTQEEQNGYIFQMHSIGCNCIETWTLDHDNNSNDCNPTKNNHQWKHTLKRTIESCPKVGATLSSDLLCLCLDTRTHLTTECCYHLFAGGVDGRIHQWYGNEMKPNISFAAHNGRIQSLEILEQLELLISSGHDGCVKCWYLSDMGGICKEQLHHHHQSKHNNMAIQLENERILCTQCLSQTNDTAEILIGCASGTMYRINCVRTMDGTISMEMQETKTIYIEGGIEEDADAPISIYSFALVPKSNNEHGNDVLVAHANGLTKIIL